MLVIGILGITCGILTVLISSIPCIYSLGIIPHLRAGATIARASSECDGWRCARVVFGVPMSLRGDSSSSIGWLGDAFVFFAGMIGMDLLVWLLTFSDIS